LRESTGEHTTSAESVVVGSEVELEVGWVEIVVVGVAVVVGLITVMFTVLLSKVVGFSPFDRLAVQLTDATLSQTYSSMNIMTRTLA
jgi:hypothetical protein